MRLPPRRLTAAGWDFDGLFRRVAVIREILAIMLIASGLGLLGWALALPDRALPVLPMAIGELATGLWLFLLRLERGARG